MKYYIRIGELPQDGKSKIYQWNDETHSSRVAVGEEAGVSVYKVTKVEGKWRVLLPDIVTKSTLDTFQYLMAAVRYNQKPAYLVTGDEVGEGYDGEPVITNIKIIEDISNDFREDNN